MPPSNHRQEVIQLLTEWGEITEQAESLGDSPLAQIGMGSGGATATSKPLMPHVSGAYKKCVRLLSVTGLVEPQYQKVLEEYARQGCNISRAAKSMGVSETWARGAVEAALHGMGLLLYLKV